MTSVGKNKKILVNILVVLSVLAAIKNIFICINVDEEYQISMGYRLLCGEKLFVDLWDPHQTSAFLIEFLMWIYRSVFGTLSGVVVWVRVCGTIIHLMISCMLYRSSRKIISDEYSVFLVLLFFNLLPKNSILPDYSLQFVWALTAALVHIFYLLQDSRSSIYHSLALGLWMCVMVLSYPSAILISPVLLMVLFAMKQNRMRNVLCFIIVCAVGGGLYLFYIIRITGSPEAFVYLLQELLRGHSAYTEMPVLFKLKHYLTEAAVCLLLCGLYCILAKVLLWIMAVARKTEFTKADFMFLSVVIGVFHHILHWLLMQWESEYGYNYALYILLFVFALCSLKNLDELTRKITVISLMLSMMELLCVLLLTDLTVYVSLKYLLPGVTVSVIAILKGAGERNSQRFGNLSMLFVFVLCFGAVFVKGWQYPASDGVMSNVLEVRGIIKQGPAKGIITEYMNSYIASSTAEEMEQLVPQGSSLLIVDDSPIAYMYEDVIVSSYTTICTPIYNEVLLDYWNMYPEKYPDVIAVRCWYGDLRWDPDSWIMRWIENEYNASNVIDGKYYRYYFKE